MRIALLIQQGTNVCGLVVVSLISVGETAGARDLFLVRCEDCGKSYQMQRNSLQQRHKRGCRGCKHCRSRLSAEKRAEPPRKDCRVCDDCPALRPVDGCPACGEPSSKRRAA